MTTRVAIVGGTGKLGRHHPRRGRRRPTTSRSSRRCRRAPSSRELDGADLVVDASTPAVSIDVVRAAIERGINVLVGTSGWSAERIALVRPLVEAAGTGAVFIPNFSLGSVHRLGARRRRGAVLPLDRDRRGAPRDEGRLAQRHRRAHRRADRRRARPRSVRSSRRTSTSARAASRSRACRSTRCAARASSPGRRSILSGPGESLTHRPRHGRARARLRARHPPRPRGRARRAAASSSVSTASSTSASACRVRRPQRAVDEGGVPGQVARATGA